MKINDNEPLVTPARIQRALREKPEGAKRLARFVSAPDYSAQAIFLACERQRAVGVAERRVYYHGKDNQY